MKTLPRVIVLVAISIALTLNASASDWAGGAGNWSSNASPGWNGTGVPNAVGAVANFPDATVGGTTTMDVAAPGIILGTLNLNGTGNFNRTVTLNANLTMDQDDAGAGFATISNSNPNTGTTNFLSIATGIGGGNLVLADDLHIINTGGGSSNNGAILIGAQIQGTGNITFSSVGNTVTSATAFPGAIRISNSNTFVGSVLLQKGAVTFNNPDAFNGTGGNVLTLGQAGQGSVTLMTTSSSGTLNNPITVAAGTGGTTMMGTASTGNVTWSSPVTLNGNLTVNSFSTGTTGITLSGAISGVGGLTFASGSGTPTTTVARLNNTTNSYQGGTTIATGTLIVAADGALGTGNVSLTAASVKLTLQTGVLNNYIADTATLSLLSTDTLNLNFTGSDTVAALVIDGVAQAPGVYNAANLSGQITGTGAINVVPEPQSFALLALGTPLLLFLRRKRA